jgi:hypothetical protein
MFAPLVAKSHTKIAASATNDRAHRRSTLVVQRLSDGLGGLREQEADCMRMPARESASGMTWNFSKIPVFAPERIGRTEPPPALIAPRVSSKLQRNLDIGAVDDPLKRQADRMANQEMRMPDPQLLVSPAPARLRRKCAACDAEEERTLRTKLAQRPGQDGGVEAPPVVHDVLRSPGQPLDPATRAFFEPRFGHDFSQVRVHTDVRAAESARAIHAQAYTLGDDIVFGTRRYSPETATGRQLLAHELAHVVQQQNSSTKGVLPVGRLFVSQPGGKFEREADAVAERIAGTTKSAVDSSTMSVGDIQRQDSGDEHNQTNQDNQGYQGTQDYQPTEEIDISEDLSAVPDDKIQRQADIPPPPPAFPNAAQMTLDLDNTVLLWNLTCMDRRERGYYIFWDDTTNKSFAGEVHRGEVWTECLKNANLNLGPVPPDTKHIYPVGFFHTHPPAPPRCRKTKVGPSDADLKFASRTGLPGVLRDTSTPTANCAEEQQGPFYFFGPWIRTLPH